MAINKVIYGGETLIDLTSDTVVAEKMLEGFTAHDKSGAPITGTCTNDVDSGDATAVAAEILNGKTAYARGNKVTGSMVNNGAVAGTIAAKAGQYTVPIGYHDGSGKVGIDSTEQSKIIPANIKQGISILGVTGTCEPSSSVTAQEKTITPGTTKQTVLPDTGYDYLSQVVVNAIPYVETANAAGGTTVTIAG
ncbi:MAG: hypothetical protein PHS74_00175 [Lachnospiraceae bacterium]|nr:hypothetical protein [Lachnospiraceae bacterium]